MQIHLYHPLTGEYVGSREARMDPRELENGTERPLVPANATLETPPEAQQGYARVYDGEEWTQVEDHRGETVYAKTDAQAVAVDWLGEIGADYTDQEPGEHPVWDEAAGEWDTDTDAQAQAREGEILAELAALDAATVRPLRAVLAATQAGTTPNPDDVSRLADLEAQAVALRTELSGLA